MSKRRSMSIAAVASAIALALIAVFATSRKSAADTNEMVMVYKSASCGCCGEWVKHLERAGFKVMVHETEDVGGVKVRESVPQPLYSCHTAKVGGYVIEGHVPADDIQRLLKERPDVAGLAVAGMPGGSPGMESSPKEPYEVRAFTRDGRWTVYSKR